MNKRKLLLSQICGCCDIPEDMKICNGKLKQKCSVLRKCVFESLTEQQLEYAVTDISSKNIYLNACPGSGKTEVVALKCAYEIMKWESTYSGMAIMTFTNSAEDEVRNRTVEYLGTQIDYPHFLGTFTSWLHNYVANPFMHIITGYRNKETFDMSIRLIETECTSDFLFSFQTKYSYQSLNKIRANQFHFDLKEQKYIYDGSIYDGQNLLDEMLSKDSWRKKELDELKCTFWKSGFATYEDIELISLYLLQRRADIARWIAGRFPVLLIDECQDLSYIQLQILKCLHSHRTIIHLVGDLDQSIYEFRNIVPNDTKEFIKDISMKEMRLTANYRSNDSIVFASMFLLDKKKYIVGKREQSVEMPLIALLYKKGEEGKLISKFESLVNENKLDLHNSRIIVRNNSLRNKIYGRKKENKSVNIIEDYARALFYHYSGHSVGDFQSSILCLARAIQRSFFKSVEHSNSKKLYKPVLMEDNEWRQIINKVKHELISCKRLRNFDLTWKEWKKSLQQILVDCIVYNGQKVEPDLGSIRKGCSQNKIKNDIGNDVNENFNCSVKTIHSCKGMSLDAVLFISAYSHSRNTNESGSHWYDWFATKNGEVREGNRLAYVAFSRARQLLVLGIPNPDSSPIDMEHKKILTDAGFKIVLI